MPTGSKRVRANYAAFLAKQEKLAKRKMRQVNIEFLKQARKRKKK